LLLHRLFVRILTNAPCLSVGSILFIKMKYNIFINQLVLSASKLDIKDCAILDYLKDFCGIDDKKIKQLEITEKEITYKYTWINFNHIIKEMPLLGIKQKASISERLKKIQKAGFIKMFRAPDRSIYIRLTEKIKELYFNGGVSLNKQRCSSKLTGVLAKTNSTTISSLNNNISNNIRLDKPTKRKNLKYPKDDYNKIINAYQELKNIKLKGPEFSPIQQAIKTMFMSGRSVKEIIACMEFMAEDDFLKDKWTIRTIRLKIPEFMAGNLEEEAIVPNYAK